MKYAAQPSSARSSRLSVMLAAAMFSSRWATDPVPGIGLQRLEPADREERYICDPGRDARVDERVILT